MAVLSLLVLDEKLCLGSTVDIPASAELYGCTLNNIVMLNRHVGHVEASRDMIQVAFLVCRTTDKAVPCIYQWMCALHSTSGTCLCLTERQADSCKQQGCTLQGQQHTETPQALKDRGLHPFNLVTQIQQSTRSAASACPYFAN